MKQAELFYQYWSEREDMTPAEALKASGMEYEVRVEGDGPGAADPSWIVTFADGSYCYIGNPHGAVFEGFIIARPYPQNTDWTKTRRRIEDRLRKDNAFLQAAIELFVEMGGEVATL